MAMYVETSRSPYQLFHRTFTFDLTASIVSCQPCVAYATFVGNSVLSFTTSDLNYYKSKDAYKVFKGILSSYKHMHSNSLERTDKNVSMYSQECCCTCE